MSTKPTAKSATHNKIASRWHDRREARGSSVEGAEAAHLPIIRPPLLQEVHGRDEDEHRHEDHVELVGLADFGDHFRLSRYSIMARMSASLSVPPEPACALKMGIGVSGLMDFAFAIQWKSQSVPPAAFFALVWSTVGPSVA